MNPVLPAAWILFAYLIGSLPTAYLVGRWLRGIDIRQVGSGNVGATNVFRTLGKGPGIVTLLIDVLKGWLPVWLSLRFQGGQGIPLLTGLAAVAGHTWTPFLGFKGGKGVATSAGVFAALLPIPTLISVLAFGLAFAVSHHVSVGSISGAVTLPIAAFFSKGVSPRFLLALCLSLLVIVKHIPNIKRLLSGRELPLK